MKKILPLASSLFLAACSNKRIIEDAMRNIGSQSQFINTPPDPKIPVWMILTLGLLIVSLVAALVVLAWSSHSHRKALEETAKKKRPSRRVKKVYLPYSQSPMGQHDPSQSHLTNHAPVQQPREYVPPQSPWGQR